MDFNKNKQDLADAIRKKIFDTDKSLFDFLNFEDNTIFMEPLLFSWFKRGDNQMTLKQLLFGYMNENRNTLKISVWSDNQGIVYLPNYGYLHSIAREKTLILSLKEGNILLEMKDTIVPFRFEPIEKLDDNFVLLKYTNDLIKHFIEVSPYELYLPSHPLHHLYSDEYRYSLDQVILADVETSRISLLHHHEIEKALVTIKRVDVDLFDALMASNRFIFPYENKLVRSFTNPASLGGIYLSVTASDGLVFYLEEIIHQGAHNFLDIAMLNRGDIFTVDSERMMGDFSGSTSDHRTLYDAFHGLFTVAKRVEFFQKLLPQTALFSSDELYEYKARFYDLKKRWKTGIERIDYKSVFTSGGLELYYDLMELCKNGFNALDEHYSLDFDMSNQPVNFSYFHFINSNPKHGEIQ